MFFSPFLAVQTSFWPLLVALVLFSLLGNIVLYINVKVSLFIVIIPLILTILVSFL
jgi:hypothetical protein